MQIYRKIDLLLLVTDMLPISGVTQSFTFNLITGLEQKIFITKFLGVKYRDFLMPNIIGEKMSPRKQRQRDIFVVQHHLYMVSFYLMIQIQKENIKQYFYQNLIIHIKLTLKKNVQRWIILDNFVLIQMVKIQFLFLIQLIILRFGIIGYQDKFTIKFG